MPIHAITLTRNLTKWHRLVYKCPELFTDILLEAFQGVCSDQHSHRGTAHAQAHLVRLQNIVAGNWKTTPDGGNTQALHPMSTIVKGISEYLSVSRFPLFWHDARVALNADRGI